MRIAIVNDRQSAVKALQRVLAKVPEHEIAWVASNGLQAMVQCAADTPDLILIDLHLPGMNCVETIARIMANSPCAIVIVTPNVSANAAQVFEAMGHGALDAVNTPVIVTNEQVDGAADLLAKIATMSKLTGKSTRRPSLTQSITQSVPPMVAIGASTGGPKALATILSQLPKSFSAAVVIVQHLDLQFASGMVDWLKTQTSLPVEVAAEGSSIVAGKVLMAATNDHLICHRNLKLGYVKEPLNYPYRPSVNVFFRSLSQHWPEKGTAVLLTGMGQDGGEGLKVLRTAGWHTIAQDEKTSVVYGMPKAAVELGAAVEVLPIDAIASALLKLKVR